MAWVREREIVLKVQAAPEYGQLLVMGSGIESRRLPTGNFYWYCPGCRRMNIIPVSQLRITLRSCEHCGQRTEITFEPVDQVAKPTVPESRWDYEKARVAAARELLME